jgi:hypothetical protein
MQSIIDSIRALFASYNNAEITSIDKLPQSGSNRIYFRIHIAGGSYIATYNDNVRENRTFFYYSRHFRAAGSPVPQVLAVNEEETIYISETSRC